MESISRLMAVAGLALALGLQPQASAQRPASPPPHIAAIPPGAHPTAARSHRPPHHAGDWLRKYKDLPPDQQQKALENDPQFRKLPPDRQLKLQQQLRRFSALPPDKQKVILKRMETWEHLTETQKKAAKNVFTKIRQLPPARRTLMMSAIRDLRHMDPQRREQAIDSDTYRSRFSGQERDLLKGVLQLPLAPVNAENQQQPPPGAQPQ